MNIMPIVGTPPGTPQVWLAPCKLCGVPVAWVLGAKLVVEVDRYGRIMRHWCPEYRPTVKKEARERSDVSEQAE